MCHVTYLWNREAKNNISGLGSNITDESVIRIGKNISHKVQNFDKINHIKQTFKAFL